MSDVRRTPPADVFDTSKVRLRQTIIDIREGHLKLLEFQRKWRWKEENIVALIESICLGHPIGSIMMLQCGGKYAYGHRCFEGSEATAGANKSPGNLVLDGQQRLTSLFMATENDGAVRLVKERGNKTHYRRIFLDMAAAVDGAGEMGRAIESVPCDVNGRPLKRKDRDLSLPAAQYEGLKFPLNAVFEFNEWEKGFNLHWSDRNPDERNAAVNLLRDFRVVVVDTFVNCEVPVIVIRRGLSVQGVCSVYEKLNTAGQPLDGFDLAIARFASEDVNLRKDWSGSDPEDEENEKVAGIQDRLVLLSDGILEGLTPKVFLQSVLMLYCCDTGEGANMWSRKHLLDLTGEQYLKYRDPMIDGFAMAARFLRHERLAAKDIKSTFIVGSLAVILAHLKRRDVLDQRELLPRLSRWFWNAFYTNHYARGHVVMATDIPEVVAWIADGAEEPRSMGGYLVDAEVIKSKPSAIVLAAVTSALLRHGATDLGTGARLPEDAEVVPVFPVSWLKDRGISHGESVVNLMLVPGSLAKVIKNRSPRNWIEWLENARDLDSDVLDRILESQGIDAAALRAEDFDAFHRARSAFILSLVEMDMGKPPSTSSVMRDYEPEEEEWPERAMCRVAARDSLVYATKVDDDVVVLAGSIMSSGTAPSLLPNYVTRRQRMIEEGKVEPMGNGRYRLKEDLIAASPSLAASVFTGTVTNRWVTRGGTAFDWKAEPAAAA